MTESDGPNSEQRQYWNEQTGPKWVSMQSFLDDLLDPLGRAATDRLGELAGKSVLDVGCGCGSTSIELARRVGENGAVLGIDLSRPMLERARELASDAGLDQLSFLETDAQTHRFETKMDAVFSRFGVMFFADPVAAFTNLRGAMRPGGTLSFVCWQAIQDNEWFMAPLAAALEHIPPPEPPAPGAPGPFAFADAERVEGILDGAGFSGVEIADHRQELSLGKGLPLEEVTELLVRLGPLNRLLQDASAELIETVTCSVGEAIRPYHVDDAVRMSSASWLVRAVA